LFKTWIAEKPISQTGDKSDCYNILMSCHFVFVFRQVVSHIFHNSYIIITGITWLLLKMTLWSFLLSQHNITNILFLIFVSF